MALIATQTLPPNGAGMALLTWTQAEVGGDTFKNTNREIVLVRGGTGWVDTTAQVEAVDDDAGRDVPVVLDAIAAVGDIQMAGPFRRKNFSDNGAVALTYPGGILGMEVAVVKFGLG